MLRRLAIIDVAKRAGFTLAEIRQLLDGIDDPGPASARWQALSTRKLRQIEETIHGARVMQRLLRDGPFSVRRAGGSWGYPSPFAYRRGPGLTQAGLLFDTLLWTDPSGDLMPWLADSWDVDEAATTYRFQLRADVRWHDGVPLTADDVAFTFHYLSQGPGRRSRMVHLTGIDAVVDVRADGPHTAVFRLARPYAPFLDWVAGRMLVAPRHIWESVAAPDTLRGPEATTGSGPYRLESSDERVGRYRYSANPSYFLGAPYVQRLDFVPAPDQLEALSEGRIDCATFLNDVRRPTSADLGRFGDPTYRVTRQPGEWTRALHFDLSRFPYRDVRFRRAIAHAIDRPALVERLLAGLGQTASFGGLAPAHPMSEADLPTYDHDPDRAQRLLDEIDLRDRTGDGERDLPGGEGFRPVLQTDTDDPGAAEMVARDLRAVGIGARVARLPPREADTAAIEGSYELAIVHYGSLGGDPDWIRLRFSRHAAEPTHAKVHGYVNVRFERLAEEQAGCLDAGRRAVLVAELQRIVAGDVPAIPLYVPDRLIVAPTTQVFDAWYFTPGGVWGGYPGSLNKHALVTGRRGTGGSAATKLEGR